MLAQEFCDPGLRSLCARHSHDKIEEVVLHDVKGVGGRHLDEINMEISCRDSGPRHREGGTQERCITDPGTATVPFDLIPMDFQD